MCYEQTLTPKLTQITPNSDPISPNRVTLTTEADFRDSDYSGEGRRRGGDKCPVAVGSAASERGGCGITRRG